MSLPAAIQNRINEVQFNLRTNWFGKTPLRKDLPQTPSSYSDRIQREREFYQLLLSRAFGNLQGLQGEGGARKRSEENRKIKRLVDVGCRNWSYARALADFFPNASLMGVEVDGGWRYWNLYRRIDFAQSYALELSKEGRDVQFHWTDFLEFDFVRPWQEKRERESTVITSFFPFVSENPCLSWGLPRRFVGFAQHLEHSKKILGKHTLLTQSNGCKAGSSDSADSVDTENSAPISPPSYLLSAHQGEWEASEAREAYRGADLSVKEIVVSGSDTKGLWPSGYDTHLFLCTL